MNGYLGFEGGVGGMRFFSAGGRGGDKNVLKLGCANDYTTLRIQGLKTVNCHHYFF